MKFKTFIGKLEQDLRASEGEHTVDMAVEQRSAQFWWNVRRALTEAGWQFDAREHLLVIHDPKRIGTCGDEQHDSVFGVPIGRAR